ncbi:MAG: hypothetical protein RLZZ597_2946 [Cyanobacteriota bacterium]
MRASLQVDRVVIYQFVSPTEATVVVEAVASPLPPWLGRRIQDPLVKQDWWPHYQRRQSVAIADCTADHPGNPPADHPGASITPHDRERWQQLQVHAALAAPLLVRQALWGLLVAQDCHQAHPWQPLEMLLLDHVAIHSGRLAAQLGANGAVFVESAPQDLQSQSMSAALYEATQQAESRWQVALEGAGAGVWDWNMQTNQVFYSRQWKTRLGYTEAEVGTDLIEWDSRVHPDDKTHTYQALEDHIQGRTEHYQSEHRLRCKDGTYKWMLDRGQVIEHAPDGKPLRMIGINHDITDRKQIEAALRQSEEALRESRNKYQTLFETLPLGIAITDAQGQLLEVNPASEQLLGLTASEQTARTYDAPDWQIIRPDGSPMPAAEFASVRALQENRFVHNMEMGIVRPDGEVTWISVSAAPIPLEQYGVAIGYVDITARKQLEQSLARDIQERLLAESQLRIQSAALEACADAVLITDVQGRVEWANPAFTAITQYNLDEAKGKNPRELVKSGQHSNSFYQQLWKTILSGQCWRGEMINRRKDGSLYYEFSTITPVFDTQGKINRFIAIKQDISERKAIELTLRQQSERERMVQVITHRIRQTLDLAQILETTVNEVCQFLDVDRVLIYRFSSAQGRTVVAESVRNNWPSSLGIEMPESYFFELESNFSHQGYTEVIDDVRKANLNPYHRQILDRLKVKAKLMVPLWQGHTLWGMMVAHQCRSTRVWQALDRDCLTQLAVQVEIAIHQSELYRQLALVNQELEQLATQDGLTQIANRRTFNRVLFQEWERLRREKQPLSLLLIDVDYFKRYNDHYGHQAGDDCLRQVAQMLQQAAQRSADLVARYGGEEFAVLLPQTNIQGAIEVAQNIQNLLHSLGIEHRYSPISPQVTVSIGLGTVVPRPTISTKQWVYQIDQALYAAKAQGRNSYVQAPVAIVSLPSEA